MAQKILGLDLGRAALRGVLLENTMRKFEVIGFYEEPLPLFPPPPPSNNNDDDSEPPPPFPLDALQRLLASFEPPDQIITCLPGEAVACHNIDLPFTDARKISQTLGFQIDELTPFALEDLIYDYQFITASKRKSRLLVGSTPRQQVDRFLSHLLQAEADPRILMADGLCYQHIFRELKEIDARFWAVLDLGHRHSTITLFQRFDDEPSEPIRAVNVRTLGRGGEHLTRAIATALRTELPQAEQYKCQNANLQAPAVSEFDHLLNETILRGLTPLLTELRRSLASHQRKYGAPLDCLFLTGGGSQLTGLRYLLRQRLGLSVETLEVASADLAPDLDLSHRQTELAKPLGLALRGMSHSRYAQLNFRQQEFAFKGDLQFLKERMGTIFVGILVLLGLLLFNISTQFYVLSAEGSRMEKQVNDHCTRILGRSVGSAQRCLLIMLDDIQKVRGTGTKALVPPVSAYDVFLQIYDRIARLLKDQKIPVEITSLRINSRRFELEGETSSFGAVDKIEQRLKSYKCFSEIKKGRARKAVGKSDKIEFRIRAKITC